MVDVVAKFYTALNWFGATTPHQIHTHLDKVHACKQDVYDAKFIAGGDGSDEPDYESMSNEAARLTRFQRATTAATVERMAEKIPELEDIFDSTMSAHSKLCKLHVIIPPSLTQLTEIAQIMMCITISIAAIVVARK